MPVERKAWACQYACGRNVATSRKLIEKHEERCWKNPARRACASCSNFKKERDGDDYRSWINYICLADDNIDFDQGKKLRHDCALWIAREVVR